MPRVMILLCLILGLAACGNRDRELILTKIKREGNGPDEFTIIPSKPLQQPQDYTALPPPTPGGVNLVDQTPRADGIAALGGNPAALVAGGVPAADGALVSHASRYGVATGIRQTLRAEDEQARRRHGRVNILNIGVYDDYTLAYRRQWLDADLEYERLRRTGGIVLPSPPPAEN